MTQLEWTSLGVLLLYICWFFAIMALAARQAQRKLWLFDRASGIEFAAAWGFRVAFLLALVWPLVAAISPNLAAADPLAAWRSWRWTDVPGHLLQLSGVLIAGAAQVGMGTSWRVGVVEEAVGDLITDGLFAFSRNPVFLGQTLLFVGFFVGLPSLATACAAALFWLSARAQIQAEERALAARLGTPYLRYKSRVGRWLGAKGASKL